MEPLNCGRCAQFSAIQLFHHQTHKGPGGTRPSECDTQHTLSSQLTLAHTGVPDTACPRQTRAPTVRVQPPSKHRSLCPHCLASPVCAPSSSAKLMHKSLPWIRKRMRMATLRCESACECQRCWDLNACVRSSTTAALVFYNCSACVLQLQRLRLCGVCSSFLALTGNSSRFCVLCLLRTRSATACDVHVMFIIIHPKLPWAHARAQECRRRGPKGLTAAGPATLEEREREKSREDNTLYNLTYK